MKDPVITEARKMLVKYLHDEVIQKGISIDQLSEKTGMDPSNITRIFSGKYSPSIDIFLILCRALDCYIFVIDKNADDDLVEMMKNRWRRNFDEQ